MANNVIRFVLTGPDLAALRQFYEDVFGWQLYQVQPDFLVVETYPHSHDETGNDIGPPITLEVNHGALVWRYASEEGPGHVFVHGIPDVGIGQGQPGTTVFIETDDINASLEAVMAHGGAHVGGPVEIPGYATVARFSDPAGNVIGLQQPVRTT